MTRPHSRVRDLLRPLFRKAREPLDVSRLRALAREVPPHGERLARAVRSARELVDDPLVPRIEAQRARLLADHGKLCPDPVAVPFAGEEELTVAQVCRVSRSPISARVLHGLVTQSRPRVALELGTNVGISASYIAAALARLPEPGRLVTLEGSPYRRRRALEVFREVGLTNVDSIEGVFEETLSSALRDNAPIDLAFVDGNHYYEPTLRYAREICAAGGDDLTLIFDDIRWSDEMERAWKSFRREPRVRVALDLGSMGVCVVARAPVTHHFVTRPITSIPA